MRGTTAECVQHFLGQVDDDKAGVLMEFVRITSLKTVRSWRKGAQLPTGEKLLRLRVFLELVGYQVAEMRSGELAVPAMRVLWLIGLGALEVSEVVESLNYSMPSGLFRVLLGGGVPQRTQAYRLEMLARNTDEDLVAAKELWEERIAPLRQFVGVTASEFPPLAPPKPETTAVVTEEPVCTEPPSQPSVPRSAAPSPKQGSSEKSRGESGSDRHASAVTHHLILALDASLRTTPDVAGLVEELKDQVSTRRLRTIRTFIDRVLGD